MSERISQDQLLSIYDQGVLGFNVDFFHDINSLLPIVDLDKIIESKNARKKIRQLTPQSLYLSLKNQGLENSLEVLPLISKGQWQRLVDYDGWWKDELLPKQVFSWLSLYYAIEPKQMGERFIQLDEEYQVGLLSSLIKIYSPEEFEDVPESEQDLCVALPGESLFYQIFTDDEELRSGILKLIDSLLQENVAYAMSLLAHATYRPPLEDQELVKQFRKARLEEDGFVTHEEGNTLFITKNILQELRNRYPQTITGQTPALFQEEIFEALTKEYQFPHLKQQMLFLANSFCSVLNMDTISTEILKELLKNIRSLLNLALEDLCAFDFSLGQKILATEHPKNLIRYAFALVKEPQRNFINFLVENNFPESEKLARFFNKDKYGAVLSWFDKYLLDATSFEDVERLKGFFNRFPLALTKAVSAEEHPTRFVFQPVSSKRLLLEQQEELNRLKEIILIPIMEINCGLGARSKSPGVDALVNEDDL